MVVRQILPKLTKNDILSRFNQVDIFATYLDMKVETIEDCIDSTYLIRSPLRTDIHPSVGFKYNNQGKLKMKDFAGYFWGDIFDLVAYLTGKNVSTKQGFYEVLIHIAITMGIYNADIKGYKHEAINLDTIRNRRKVLEVEIRDWTKPDIMYWGKRNINMEYLRMYKVYPVFRYYIDRDSQPEPKYHYRASDPCYAYYFGKDANGIQQYELYFPLRKREEFGSKFITNAHIIKGLDKRLVTRGNKLLLTKSYKDVMSIRSIIDRANLPISVIGVPSENFAMSKLEYEQLNRYFNGIGSLFDFDRTGVVLANKYRKQFNITPFFITNGKFGTKAYKAKDFSELFIEIGEVQLTNLMIDIYERLNGTNAI